MDEREIAGEEDTSTITLERRYVVPGLIMGIIAVMAITVMGVQWVPFTTRQESVAEHEMYNQRFAQADLRMASDEARIQKLEDNYATIQSSLAELNTNLAKYAQQVVDEQRYHDKGH